ncbi:MAG: flagellar hook-length control protein FliK [Treponema sp.]
MQPLDIQKDMQPLPLAEKAGEISDKKIAGKQSPKNDAFSELLKKMLKDPSAAAFVDSAEAETDMLAAGMEDTKRQNLLKQLFDTAKNKNNQKNIDADTVPVADEESDSDAYLLAEQLLQTSEAEAAVLSAGNLFPDSEALSIDENNDSAALTASAAELILPEDTEKPVFKKESAAMKELPEAARSSGSSENAAGTLTAFEQQVKNTLEYAPPKPPKPVLSVVDERTPLYASLHSDFAIGETSGGLNVENSNTLDMLFDFRGAVHGSGTHYESSLFAKETGTSSFTSVLAQQVQDMAADFVQAGKIILQDNNAGIIRLQMQPAYLGSVKINLELAGDKRIVGKIVAASKETYEAFKESVGQLTEAFEQGGFENVQFDVSWSGESGSNYFAQDDSSFENSFAKNQQLEVMGSQRYADTQVVYDVGSNYVVNVFA